MTSAPRAAATSASSKPIRPDERFVRYRTGSIGSRVGPAATTTLRPARAGGMAASSRACATASTISGISARRPGPSQPHASSPSPGSMIVAPRSRSVRRCPRVASCVSMLVFIAGAIRIGARTARWKVVRKSSASPRAMRAMTWAVAGATRKTSVSSVSEMCRTPPVGSGPSPAASPGTASGNSCSSTGSPETVARESGETNSRAARVRITCTRRSRFRRARTRSGAL